MNKTAGITIFLLFIIVGILSTLLVLESNESKKNREELHKITTEVKGVVEQLEKDYNSVVEEYKKVNDLNKSLQQEIEDLKEENEDLKKRLEAKLERDKQLLAMNGNSSSSTNTNNNTNTTPTGTKTAYLTFDDGPSKNTEKILDILKEHGIKATFFVNGRTDDYSTSLYKRIVNEGHSIGNHTYSHKYSEIYQSKAAFMKSFYKLENHVKDITGVKMDIARYPGGSNNTVSHKYGGKNVNKEIARELVNNGYVYFDWNVDSRDAEAVTVSEDRIVNNVLSGAKGKTNAIILFHDSGPKTTTASALPKIIEGLKEQGFNFDRVTKDTYAPQYLKP